MGGHALKQTPTRRYNADEYYILAYCVQNTLSHMFEDYRCEIIPSYKNKESFGDCDILLQSDFLPSDWVDQIKEEFQCREMVKNGNVLSFAYRQLQIDIITMPDENFTTAYNYFAYNDLSNLIGRVARKVGLKYGHDGLSYDFQEGTEHYKNVILLKDLDSILEALQYDPAEYHKGFNDLEDIFKFVVSSPFFSKDIFALENRNHAARVRDNKRKTYMEFLKWLDGYVETEEQIHFDWYMDVVASGFKAPITVFACIPEFREIYSDVMYEWSKQKQFKAKYNGDVVSSVIGLQGKELGLFMKWMKPSVHQDAVLALDEAHLKEFIEQSYKIYKEKS